MKQQKSLTVPRIVHKVSTLISVYYINSNEIPGDLSCENMIPSHVKITIMLFSNAKISPLQWLHNKSRLSQEKTVSLKWFGISLVFI